MSIIRSYNEGKTDKNKLKYAPLMGASHPGRPPLITKRIPTEPSTSTKPEPSNPLKRRLDDVSRISQLLIRPEGINFISNNLALNTAKSLSYKQGPTLKDKVSALSLDNAGNAALDTVFLLGSTLAQVGVAGTGTHFVRGFGDRNFISAKKSSVTFYQGDPGSVSVRYGVDKPFSPTNSLAVDTINARSPQSQQILGNSELEFITDDYIKFFIQILQPEDLDGNGQIDSTFLYFRAYLDSLSDSYNANWNSFNYVGRGEPFYTYNSFGRSISFSFKVAAQTKLELMPIYSKLQHLIGSTAPSYSEGGFMRGTMAKVTIGDYLAKQPGFFTGINLNWNKEYPWEIAYYKDHEGKEIAGPNPETNTDLLVNQLPTVLDVSATFTPIHRFTPESLRLDSSEGAFDGRSLNYISKPIGLAEAEGSYEDWRRGAQNE